MSDAFEDRKKSHLDLALKKSSQSLQPTGFERIRLRHEALPELDFEEISCQTSWRGHSLKAPFFVCSMTGGWSDSPAFNLKLAQACEKRGWLMGMGSQRGQLDHPFKIKEWEEIKKACPQLKLLGNLGISQALKSPFQKMIQLIEALDVAGMIVHLNPLQEALQKEGTPQFKGGLERLKALTQELAEQSPPIPLIVKETGCGFCLETLDRLTGLGLSAVDISGAGGTNWGRIEAGRYGAEDFRSMTGPSFADWGIPTLQSLMFAQQKPRDYDVWASGGLRNGLDAAKALSLGATLAGFGWPILQALQTGPKALDQTMARLEFELKVSLFCSGSKNIKELSGKWQFID